MTTFERWLTPLCADSARGALGLVLFQMNLRSTKHCYHWPRWWWPVWLTGDVAQSSGPAELTHADEADERVETGRAVQTGGVSAALGTCTAWTQRNMHRRYCLCTWCTVLSHHVVYLTVSARDVRYCLSTWCTLLSQHVTYVTDLHVMYVTVSARDVHSCLSTWCMLLSRHVMYVTVSARDVSYRSARDVRYCLGTWCKLPICTWCTLLSQYVM